MDARDRPAIGLGIENGADLRHENCGVILQFGDLDIEANRVRLVEAMILDRVLPGADADASRLEAAVFDLPRSTVDKLIATRSKLFEEHRQSVTLLLEGFQNGEVREGTPETGDALFH